MGNKILFIPMIFIFVISVAQIRADTSRQTLLEALFDMRNAAISQVTSGRGIAAEQSDNFQSAMHGNRELVPLHRVEFIFSGANSLWREYDPNDPKKLVSCILIKNGLKITYYIFSAHTGVMVEAIDPQVSTNGFSILDPLPKIWSLDYFTRIPYMGWDEKSFFTALLQVPYVKCSKNNALITINLNVPTNTQETGLTTQNMTAQFNTIYDGMLVNYNFISGGENGVNKYLYKYVLNMTWRKSGAVFVPANRNVDELFENNGENDGFWRTQVTFTKFVTGPVSPNELTIAAMQIPVGTLVTDQVHQNQFNYSPAMDQQMLKGVALAQPQEIGK